MGCSLTLCGALALLALLASTTHGFVFYPFTGRDTSSTGPGTPPISVRPAAVAMADSLNVMYLAAAAYYDGASDVQTMVLVECTRAGICETPVLIYDAVAQTSSAWGTGATIARDSAGGYFIAFWATDTFGTAGLTTVVCADKACASPAISTHTTALGTSITAGGKRSLKALVTPSGDRVVFAATNVGALAIMCSNAACSGIGVSVIVAGSKVVSLDAVFDSSSAVNAPVVAVSAGSVTRAQDILSVVTCANAACSLSSSQQLTGLTASNTNFNWPVAIGLNPTRALAVNTVSKKVVMATGCSNGCTSTDVLDITDEVAALAFAVPDGDVPTVLTYTENANLFACTDVNCTSMALASGSFNIPDNKLDLSFFMDSLPATAGGTTDGAYVVMYGAGSSAVTNANANVRSVTAGTGSSSAGASLGPASAVAALFVALAIVAVAA